MKKTLSGAAAGLLLAVAIIAGSLTTNTSFAQGTAFTYQGRLDNGSAVASGIYDFQFGLYDAASAGVQQGNLLTNTATAVSNGLFTVTLDFGNQFPGANRWLELAVRTNGSGAFTTLAPRQPLTAMPYAVYAPTAGAAVTAASAGSVAAANITGTLATTQLPASIITNGASGVSITGTFNGNGAGLTNLPPSDKFLTGRIALSTSVTTFYGAISGISAGNITESFVATLSPHATTTLKGMSISILGSPNVSSLQINVMVNGVTGNGIFLGSVGNGTTVSTVFNQSVPPDSLLSLRIVTPSVALAGSAVAFNLSYQ